MLRPRHTRIHHSPQCRIHSLHSTPRTTLTRSQWRIQWRSGTTACFRVWVAFCVLFSRLPSCASPYTLPQKGAFCFLCPPDLSGRLSSLANVLCTTIIPGKFIHGPFLPARPIIFFFLLLSASARPRVFPREAACAYTVACICPRFALIQHPVYSFQPTPPPAT